STCNATDRRSTTHSWKAPPAYNSSDTRPTLADQSPLAGTPASCSPADAALPALPPRTQGPAHLTSDGREGMNDTSTATRTPESLRDRMVDRVQAAGWARRPGVEQAMRTVPRHRYVPAAPIEDAYDEQAVITKRAADGAALSCASVPGVVAMMLDQLDVRPGDRILEIGAGTGYNAALLAHLTGRAGHVSTI